MLVIFGCFKQITMTTASTFELIDNPIENERRYFHYLPLNKQRSRRDLVEDAGKIVDNILHTKEETIGLMDENNKKSNISSYFDKNIKNTNNITTIEEDDHLYYKSTYYRNGRNYFLDISDEACVQNHKLKLYHHPKLSTSYEKAYVLKLNFSFPFYGNLVDKIVVTTGGFINIGPMFHSYIHIVHYVAPLMANFNPSQSNDTKVYIASNENMYIIQWNDLTLNGTDNLNETFTFQTILHKNGSILLAYKEIPISPLTIKNTSSLNVTVGFSDGFLMTFLRNDSRTHKIVYHSYIYSYHKVKFALQTVQSNAAYQLDLLPNCIQFKDCNTCTNASVHTQFKCRWCSRLNLCSDTLDWHRQKWLLNKCQLTSVGKIDQCHLKPSDKNSIIKKKEKSDDTNSSHIGVIVGVIIIVVIVCIVSFFLYAYFYPTSKPGMWLIEHRPGRMFTVNFDKVPEEELL